MYFFDGHTGEPYYINKTIIFKPIKIKFGGRFGWIQYGVIYFHISVVV